MERRKFIAGLGSLTAAGAAGIGTGAFTSVEADRGLSVSIANDNNALLALGAVPGNSNHPNAQYLSSDGSSGEIAIDVQNLNTDAETDIDNLFRIKNQGTQPVWVWFTLTGNGFKTQVYFYPDGDQTESFTTYGSNGGVLSAQGASQVAQKVPAGTHVDVGMFIDVPDGSMGKKFKNGELRIHADSDKSNAPNPETPSGT